jgi:anaerobic selenocysteine-containing dehydrogenase
MVGLEIDKAQSRGAKLIVVNPKRIPHAKKADLWLQVKPGADAALALGMLNVIINEELYDWEFVSKHCIGFNELKQHVQKYSPEKVEKITWISKNKIIKAARMFAENKPATIRTRVALDHSYNSVQTLRAIIILAAVCGYIDVKGGLYIPKSTIIPEFVIGWYEGLKNLPNSIKKKTLGISEFPLYSGPDADQALAHPNHVLNAILSGKPYPIKALISICNLAMYLPNTRRVWKALKSLDFMVTIDLFMTPTAELSDIVLPAACWLEKEGLWGCDLHPYVVSVAQKAVEPLGERWDDVKIFIEIAKK